MKDRIRQIMESQHMTQQLFADYIGQSPATLSSIFNGRTRPTLNIVEAIKKKIPNINTDWLMFGSGDMYLPQNTPDQDLFSEGENTPDTHPIDQNPMLVFDETAVPGAKNVASQPQNYNGVRNTHPEIVREEVKFVDKPQRKVIEIRVFYDDQTWDTFVPAKK
ncbi:MULTISPECIES: helix-turn-helix domain-containing protein [unclassified Prevotella]|uniref:helix-turn-helix domain-containing protein n=1 Tax=unclassified Prevotella TaxID=2638335 RepID=UPI00048A8966|nr:MULTISPECIES: helix-turn-helix transcriptional regulator [unclassified Prevotella]